ncbi:MAG TPA: hypothetical protein VKA02_10590 [Candidatus Acidoferrum sp.]|nr:hypothetical protein [Candidatus Acidoferrum sp.]
MRENEHAQYRSLGRLSVIALAALLGVLVTTSLANAVPQQDKDQKYTRVYPHTYDEVFQASQETIERMGLFVADKDKDKGTISGNGRYNPDGGPLSKNCTLDIHIEALNTKPETRVTIHAKVKGVISGWDGPLKDRFLIELQKVLATYH